MALRRPGIRVLPLEDFKPVTFGVLWQGKASPIVQAFLMTIQETAKRLLSVMKIDSARAMPPVRLGSSKLRNSARTGA
jgi:hypothetical protein